MQGTPTWAGPLFMYVAIAAIFYFILLRPQNQQRRRHEALIAQLKRGDEVVTAGGVIGRVEHIQQLAADKVSMDDRITIRSGDSRLIVERRSVARVGTAAPATAGAAPNA